MILEHIGVRGNMFNRPMCGTRHVDLQVQCALMHLSLLLSSVEYPRLVMKR